MVYNKHVIHDVTVVTDDEIKHLVNNHLLCTQEEHLCVLVQDLMNEHRWASVVFLLQQTNPFKGRRIPSDVVTSRLKQTIYVIFQVMFPVPLMSEYAGVNIITQVQRNSIMTDPFPFQIFNELDEQTASMLARVLVLEFGQKKFMKYITTNSSPDGIGMGLVDYLRTKVSTVSPIRPLHNSRRVEDTTVDTNFIIHSICTNIRGPLTLTRLWWDGEQELDLPELNEYDLNSLAYIIMTTSAHAYDAPEIIAKAVDSGLTFEHAIVASEYIDDTNLNVNLLEELL